MRVKQLRDATEAKHSENEDWTLPETLCRVQRDIHELMAKLHKK